MIKQLLRIGLLAVASIGAASPHATDSSIRFSSGNRQVAMIELFTSEGCSSCPPADRWLSELTGDADLWKNFVPAAFHVDYWDYIGWRDRFAKSEFSDRQRRYASEGGVNTVYTPGVFRNGRAWRGWLLRKTVESSRVNIGDLTIQVSGDEIVASFNAIDGGYENLKVNVALLGMNLESQISGGENKGKNLQHDFVVLGINSTTLERKENLLVGRLQLPEPSVKANHKAIIAWVSPADRQAPIQATGGIISD